MTPPTPTPNPPYTIALYGDHALITIAAATDGTAWMNFWRSHGQAIAESLRDRVSRVDIFLSIECRRLDNLDRRVVLDVIEAAKKTPEKH